MTTREPILQPVSIEALRPTQITVGFREVAQKRKQWRDRAARDGSEYLGHHMIPVLHGPKSRYFIIDHHHLVRALHEEGIKDILVNVVADLTSLTKDAFWVLADNHGWCHPYDSEGHRLTFDAIPTSIDGLKDDPFRSLAGELRRAGGYAKDATPFSEFIWADFLRRRIKRKLVETDFGAALTKALVAAKSTDAGYLPGWCGPAADV